MCPHITGKVASYDKFDNEFFGYSIKQSEAMDPEERKQLEVTFEALADAGVDPSELRGSNTGLYKGDCFQHTSVLKIDPFYPMKEPHSITTRTMYHYDLKGPFFHVDLACASSFGGFHEAVQAIKYGLCESAIVIGTNTVFDPMISYQMNNLTFLSPTGECRSLSDDANGYLRSEANVALVLQKRKVAKRVYATVLHTITGCDGYKPEGITFPGRETQEALMKQAYSELEMDPRVIKYVEAHATGTKAGDPVEMTAIYNTYCIDRPEEDPVLVGCLKSNLGHTEGVSGVCALAKACISFQRESIAPNIHFKKPNPMCPGITDGTTNGEVTEAPSTGVIVPVIRTTEFKGNFVALNSFGFGGANVHSVLRKEPKRTGMNPVVDVSKSGPRLVHVRGRTKESVEYIYDYVRKNSKAQNPDFLYLLDNYSNFASGEMPFRGYFLLDRSHEGRSHIKNWIQVEPRRRQGGQEQSWSKTQPSQGQPVVSLYFTDTHPPLDCNNNSNPGCEFIPELMTLEPFGKAVKRMTSAVDGLKLSGVSSIQDLIQKKQPETQYESVVLSIVTQLALVDTLKSIGLKARSILGRSIGELACAYWFDLITPEEALLAGANSELFSIGSPTKGNMIPGRKSSKFKKLLTEMNKERLWTSVSHESAVNGEHKTLVEVSTSGLFMRPTPGKKSIRERPVEKTYDLVQTLETIGQLYMNGCDISVGNLYPKPDLPTSVHDAITVTSDQMGSLLHSQHVHGSTTHGEESIHNLFQNNVILR